MLALEPPVAGFTTFAAEGHGMSFATASVGERVQGRVERTVMMVVMPRAEADRLVEIVRQKMPVPHMAYWIEPVLACGRLAEAPALASDTREPTATALSGGAR